MKPNTHTATQIKRTDTAVLYVIQDQAGRPVGQVEWKMTGPDVGQHFYSLASGYRPAQLRKIFRSAVQN